jgi:hypothetical protein
MRAPAGDVGIRRWREENSLAAVSMIFFCSGRNGEEEEEEEEDGGRIKSESISSVFF